MLLNITDLAVAGRIIEVLKRENLIYGSKLDREENKYLIFPKPNAIIPESLEEYIGESATKTAEKEIKEILKDLK